LVKLSNVDLSATVRFLQQAQASQSGVDTSAIQPVEIIKLHPQAGTTANVDSPLDPSIKSTGEQAIANGSVAAVILSGGQGTRLGHNGPKGMFTLPLVSESTIFQLHVERILKLKKLLNATSIPIYIMTSDLNDQMIRDFFKEKNYFGFPVSDIVFFQQGLLPCFDMIGKIIVESPTSLSMAPDGNGGIYEALRFTGAYDDMITRGVKYLHIYGIDNILIKSLDPLFIGLCIKKEVECGNKVVRRVEKSEKVGLTVNIHNKMHVLEYSEIPDNLGESTHPGSNALVYDAANICSHFLTLQFLANSVFPNLSSSYHIALKKIAYYDESQGKTVTPTSNNGMKLEMFIFDVFPFASKWLVCEALREDEFAPIKNANNPPGAKDAVDSPASAVKLMSNQAKRWLTAAGAILQYPVDNSTATAATAATATTKSPSELASEEENIICEMSALTSYDGEGLEKFKGQTIILPVQL